MTNAATVLSKAAKVATAPPTAAPASGSTMNHAAIVSWIALALMVPALILAEKHVNRTSRGRVVKYHGIYWGVALAIIILFPHSITHELFSPLTVTIIGSVFPIYESIRAICTPQGDDDKSWVQYWIAQGIITYSTEWVDDVAERSEGVRTYFYMFEFFFLVWLMLPWTDGACLLYDYITKPLCQGWVDDAARKMNKVLSSIVNAMISAAHLWILWALFLFFPPELKRFVTVSVGVVYPLFASIVAVSTEDTYDDDTFWLTYWSCYGCLYLIMCFLETWLGRIPGFYSIVIFGSVYLMVPVFRGAEKVFRNILVPLTGMQEMLLLRDALIIKKEVMAQVPKGRRRQVRKIIAESFSGQKNKQHIPGMDDDDIESDDEQDPLIQYGMYGATGTNSNATTLKGGKKQDSERPGIV